MIEQDFSAIEQALGHSFSNRDVLLEALTHSSHAFENGTSHNERLEFLGDSILNACTTLFLVERFPDEREGALSRLRARLVSTVTLAGIGRILNVGQTLRLGRGEEGGGGREREALLADATEALLGAVFVDAGFARCREIVEAWMLPQLVALDPREQTWGDPRSRLQELAQQKWHLTPSYEVVSTEGPAHAPTFLIEVRIGDTAYATGRGGSKRDAAREAAANGLAKLQTDIENGP